MPCLNIVREMVVYPTSVTQIRNFHRDALKADWVVWERRWKHVRVPCGRCESILVVRDVMRGLVLQVVDMGGGR